MKPVLLGLCLVFIFMTVTVSASLDNCPTCGFDYDGGALIGENPYAGCPTCIFAYDDDGLMDENPYAGCPTCVFAYYPNGTLIPNAPTGCTPCSVYSGTTNTLVGAFSSFVSPSATIYRFTNGTAIPEDYLCPIHGIYCPDDPRPLEERPGYIAPVAEIGPTLAPHVLPKTSAEFISSFKRPDSMLRISRLSTFLNR